MELMLEIEIACPHCGEIFPLQIDTSQGNHTIIEDCTVCCRPITLRLQCRPGEVLTVAEED
jgi:phage terminase large subunit GpA-like protein